MTKLPLVVDLDGTLICIDTTYELCVEHLKKFWIIGLFELFVWFTTDKATAKDKLATLHAENMNLGVVPLTDLIHLELFKEAPSRALISGSDHRIVTKLADRIGEFELVQGTTSDRNLI